MVPKKKIQTIFRELRYVRDHNLNNKLLYQSALTGSDKLKERDLMFKELFLGREGSLIDRKKGQIRHYEKKKLKMDNLIKENTVEML